MIKTFVPFGYDGAICDVDVDLRRGIPAFDIVGITDDVVSNMRMITHAAIDNSGLQFPPERVLLSLSPADLKKSGGYLDLPVALAVLETQYKLSDGEKILALGELKLSGEILPVKACYAALLKAKDEGIKYAILPEKDKMESVPEGISVCYASHLLDAFNVLKDKSLYSPVEKETEPSEIAFDDTPERDMSLDEIKGHDGLKFAMAVAAAGRHSLLTVGGPGSGKTTCLQCFPELLPLLNTEEKAEVDKISSIAGLTYRYNSDRAWVRPFRMPHQTASIKGMCGGGPDCRPGEITLAHNGVLFLDEAAEFRTSVLQMLRVPMENHTITLSRAGRFTTYPANFQLLMATNPCPCGNYGSPDRVCLCSVKSVEQYWKKFSAPLLDRVAIRYDMYDEMICTEYSVKELRQIVRTAWERQYARQGKLNGDLMPDELDSYMSVAPDFEGVLTCEAEKHGWQACTVQGIKKLSLTVADMAEADVVTVEHLKVALELHGKQIENILGNA